MKQIKRYFFGVGDGVGDDAGDGAGVGDEVAAPAGDFSAPAAPPGAGTLSGGGFLSLIDSNSTSKMSVAFGPMGPPGVPRGP
jgi:hypothetical protein